MNPLLVSALGSIFRWGLAFGAGWMVERGIWSQQESTEYVAALAMALASLVWGLWQKYRSRIHFLTALNVPSGTNEQAVAGLIKDGFGVKPTLTKG